MEGLRCLHRTAFGLVRACVSGGGRRLLPQVTGRWQPDASTSPKTRLGGRETRRSRRRQCTYTLLWCA